MDGRCPLHPTREILSMEEENYFFRLSDYRDRLVTHIEENPKFIQPLSRRNEILGLLQGGLEDISASRSRVSWGVPFPGDPEHTVYVWFDALPNYISAVGYPEDGFERRWPAALHVIGKDITRFHCVIWPAMLMSAGIELPETVWAHGFVMIAGGKLSKSEAQLLDLELLIDRHGPDAFRFILLREAAWDSDRDFPTVQAFFDQFDARYEADLANDLGNLLNRTVSMIRKYREGSIPITEAESDLDSDPGAGIGTPLDAPFNEDGCSGGQLVTLICSSAVDFPNHGLYVSCVAKVAGAAYQDGLLTHKQRAAIIRVAAKP